MDNSYIEWCTNRLDQTWRTFTIKEGETGCAELNLEDCKIRRMSDYDLYSNELDYNVEDSTYAYALMKGEEFQAMRLYGMDRVNYKYVQYIKGIGIQVVGNAGKCVFINKVHNHNGPIPSRFIDAPPIGEIFSKSFYKPNEEIKGDEYMLQASFSLLSLYGLSYEGKYFDIICVDLYYETCQDQVLEFIKTMGLYHVFLNKGKKGPKYNKWFLVIAWNEQTFLKYFKPVKGGV